MNHPLRSRLSLATAFFACFLVTSPAHAQQQINIDPVLVTLDRFEEKSSRAPLGMEIITANQIEVAGHQSLPEFLSSHSGISLVNNFFGNGSQSAAIDIRGYGAVGD